MRKLIISFALMCLMSGMHTAALACETRYDPATKIAVIPCVGIVGGTQVFGVRLEWTGGNNYVAIGSGEYGLVNPQVNSLKILTTPIPVAIIFGQYSDGCGSAYRRPSFVQTGNHIDISLKAQFPLPSDLFNCSAASVPFAEVVKLPSSASSQMHTYSVNGQGITPSF